VTLASTINHSMSWPTAACQWLYTPPPRARARHPFITHLQCLKYSDMCNSDMNRQGLLCAAVASPAGWCPLLRCPRHPTGLPTSSCGCQQQQQRCCQSALSSHDQHMCQRNPSPSSVGIGCALQQQRTAATAILPFWIEVAGRCSR
jgi:hypothetical protein